MHRTNKYFKYSPTNVKFKRFKLGTEIVFRTMCCSTEKTIRFFDIWPWRGTAFQKKAFNTSHLGEDKKVTSNRPHNNNWSEYQFLCSSIWRAQRNKKNEAKKTYLFTTKPASKMNILLKIRCLIYFWVMKGSLERSTCLKKGSFNSMMKKVSKSK